MLTLDHSPTYQAPVVWKTLDANGEIKEHVFLAVFKRFTTADMKQFFEGPRRDDDEVAAEVLKGWAHVAGGDGMPLPFTPENVTTLLNLVGMPTAIVEALVNSWRPTVSAKSVIEAAASKN